MAVEPRTHKDMAGGVEPIVATQPEYELGTTTGTVENITPDGDEPTEEELHSLRKVADKLPWSAFLVAVVELCERYARIPENLCHYLLIE